MIGNLGTGDALKSKIDDELKKQGLKESSGVTAPAKAGLSGDPLALSPLWVLVLAAHVFALSFV